MLGFAITQALDAYAKCVWTFDAQAETTSQTLATAVAPAITELFHWDQLAVTVSGSAVKVTQADCHLMTPMKVDRFFAGQVLKSEPIRNAKRDLGGSLVCEFESLTSYNAAVADIPTNARVPVIFTWTGTLTYDTAKPFMLVITYNSARFDPVTPLSNAEDVIPLTRTFVGMQETSLEPITVVLKTSEPAV